MYKVTILSIGKTKENWLHEAIDLYSKRLSHNVSIKWEIAKDNEQLEKLCEKHTHLVALDPKGKLFTSEQFSSWMNQTFIKQGTKFAFIIGGAEGLNDSIRLRANELVSFSPLTFTHQLARLILLEQIYRAIEIQKNSPYHK